MLKILTSGGNHAHNLTVFPSTISFLIWFPKLPSSLLNVFWRIIMLFLREIQTKRFRTARQLLSLRPAKENNRLARSTHNCIMIEWLTYVTRSPNWECFRSSAIVDNGHVFITSLKVFSVGNVRFDFRKG